MKAGEAVEKQCFYYVVLPNIILLVCLLMHHKFFHLKFHV